KAKQSRLILTFGYGNRKDYAILEEYLQQFSIKYVVDIRISPRAWSRRWYKDKIREFCLSKNVEYLSKTDLGNISGKENWIPPDRQKAEAELSNLAEIAHNDNILLLCAEMDSRRCHRTDVANCLENILELDAKIIHLK
ncbi:MAG: DUF488 family protein, partial [Halothece sp.]